MSDYRFDALVHGLRKQKEIYAFSVQASEELSRNDAMSAEYTDDMHEDFWRELENEYRAEQADSVDAD